MLLQRYEKGMRFLDLWKLPIRSKPEEYDVFVTVFDNQSDHDSYKRFDFSSVGMAKLFIIQNGWTEQCQAMLHN